MKQYSLLMAPLLLFMTGNGQINFNYLQTDSLKQELSKAGDDTTRILLMANISESYRWSHSDSAMFYGQSGLALAERIKFKRGEAASLISMSVVQREIGNLAKALDLALKALSITQQHGFGKEEISALLRVANVYAASKNYTIAINYFLQAATKSQEIGSIIYQGISYWLIAAAYEQTNRLDSAQVYADKALFYEKSPTGAAFAYNILGDIQMKKGNEAVGLRCYWEGLKKAGEVSDYRTEANLNISLANYYKGKNLFDSAVYYGQKALSTAQLLSYKNRIISSSSILASLYEGRNDAEALKYYKIFLAAKDSLHGPEKMLQLQNLVMEEQQKQKAAEAAKLAYESRTRQFALIGGLAVFLIVMLLLYHNNRKQQKANRLLHQQKTEIQNTLAELKTTQAQLIQSEKMASLGELTAGIAHEIQNPLNFVNNFSEVNKELIVEMKEELIKGNIEEAKTIADDIKDNEEKITYHGKRADAIVKGMLQHSRASSTQKELTDINALADEYLRLSYHGLRAKDKSFNAEFTTEFDETVGQVNIIPQDIGRVLLNLYNNAFYSVNEKKKQSKGIFEPKVHVSTKRAGDDVIISVRDNGNGIQQKVLEKIYQPFFTTKPAGKGTGLGLSLSYDIIKKGHGGELRVETMEGEFAQFKIILPAQSNRVNSN